MSKKISQCFDDTKLNKMNKRIKFDEILKTDNLKRKRSINYTSESIKDNNKLSSINVF